MTYRSEWHLQLTYALDVVTDPHEVFPRRGYETPAAYLADQLLGISEGDLRASGIPEELIKKRNWLFTIVNTGDPLNVGVDGLRELLKLMYEFETQEERIIS